MKLNYVKVNADAFKKIQFEAGVVTKTFDPTNPALDESDIVAVTSGGINITCQATYIDLFEDIDNVPNNTKEGKQLDGWDCGLGFTALGMTEEQIRLNLGASDIATESGVSGGTLKKISPRAEVHDDDFGVLWWIGDTVDGGFCAVKLENALSTEGVSIQTTKKGKGNTSVTIKGHFSIKNIEKVPMDFYVFTPASA